MDDKSDLDLGNFKGRSTLKTLSHAWGSWRRTVLLGGPMSLGSVGVLGGVLSLHGYLGRSCDIQMNCHTSMLLSQAINKGLQPIRQSSPFAQL